MFERETKREKIIEAKQRELRTKLGHKPTQKADDFLTKAELATEETEREIAELVEKLVSYRDFTFFNNQLRKSRIYVFMYLYYD